MRKTLLVLGCLFMLTLLNTSCKNNNLVVKTKSKYYTDSLYSNHLKEYRKHNIYLPQNFTPKDKYPVIYATDGGTIKDESFLKSTLDSLISNQIIAPIIFVESHSNKKIADSTSTTTGDGKVVKLQYRNFEYVNYRISKEEDALLYNRFDAHKSYFKDELISEVENNFSLELTTEDRFFYGVSNGAGFGMSLLNSNPEIIGTYICLSTFGGDIRTNTWQKDIEYPKLYLRYGSEEPQFLKEDADFLKAESKALNLTLDANEFKGGHDYLKWRELLTEILTETFKT